MSAQIMTLQQYQTLALGLRYVQVIETDGLLITRGLLDARGYVFALQPFASATVTLIHESKASTTAERAPSWMMSSWLGAFWSRGVRGA